MRLVSCHLIDGIFTEPTLEPGYNLVAVIPRGALALNVTELRHTHNYLGKRIMGYTFIDIENLVQFSFAPCISNCVNIIFYVM